MIQLLLGLTVADGQHLGVHPAIELGEYMTSALPGQELTTNGLKRRLSDVDEHYQAKRVALDATSSEARWAPSTQLSGPGPMSVTGPQPTHYRFRTPLFINLPDDDPPIGGPSNTTRYFLDYLDYDHGKLWGRQTRVWCAYKETKPDDPTISDEHRRTLREGEVVYVGPYAVKLAYVDTSFPDIVSIVQRKRDDEGAKYVLLPDRFVAPVYEWYGCSDAVRRSWSGQRVRRSSSARELESWSGEEVAERQEVFSVSPFKRKLSQYENLGEVVRALADVSKG